MTKQELLTGLKELQKERDCESSHEQADTLLLDYINDDEITEAFLALKRYYA